MASSILTVLVVIFAGLLYFVYDGYVRVLRVADHFARRRRQPTIRPDAPLPTVAALITVFNEAHQIVERVENILAQDYPPELLDVVVASDGSTDDLAATLTLQFGELVRLVHVAGRVGKSPVQNMAVDTMQASVVLFTDADTRFAPGFVRALVAPFAEESIGAVQAHLLFVPADPSAPPAGQARYWRSELEIRQLEANLGILAVASGCCIAVRRDLWRPLDAKFGEDCIIPLDVVAQSRTVAYAPDAIAYEPADKEFDNVIATRARMTMRNWQGTCSRSVLLNPFAHPRYAFALWSHKMVRWLSPVWLVGLSLCAFTLPFVASGRLLLVPAVAMAAFYLLAAIGALARRRSGRVPVCTSIYAFLLANLGFLGGLVRVARGGTISRYR